jgi:hypothetical protein
MVIGSLSTRNAAASTLVVSLAQHLAWPLVALWGLGAFRPSIEQLATRVTEFYGAKLAPARQDIVVEPSGQSLSSELGATEQQKQVTTHEPKARDAEQGTSLIPLSDNTFDESYFSHVAVLTENQTVNAELVALHGELNWLKQQTRMESEKVLVKYLATTRVTADFRQTATVMYGSQMRLLHALQSGPVNEPFAKALKAQSQTPSIALGDYGAWISFLVQRQLVNRETSGELSTTVRGKDFYAWELKTGLNLAAKPD